MTGSRPRVLALALTTLAGALLVACGADAPTSSDAATGRVTNAAEPSALRRPELAAVGSFALALGVDPLDDAAIERLGAYDLVVVDGGSTEPEQVAALQERGTLVLGYLSAGTVEPYRPWYATARDEGWLLDEWEDWDEWYAEVAEPGLRDLLVTEARRELDQGFDGLFLDNTDMVASHPDQVDGMVALVAALDAEVGDGLLFAQNGDDTVGAIADHLDGWNREDVTATYDFDAEAYAEVDQADGAAARATLRRLRADGLLVTATDYTARADDPLAGVATDRACRAGALPFTSDIGLTRIASTPTTCR